MLIQDFEKVSRDRRLQMEDLAKFFKRDNFFRGVSIGKYILKVLNRLKSFWRHSYEEKIFWSRCHLTTGKIFSTNENLSHFFSASNNISFSDVVQNRYNS